MPSGTKPFPEPMVAKICDTYILSLVVSELNIIVLAWWTDIINIGSGNGLVSSGTKQFPEPMVAKFCDTHILSPVANELNVTVLAWLTD